MYRDYENPRTLEAELAVLKQQRADAVHEWDIEALDESIADLEHRINCAWQDEEYD